MIVTELLAHEVQTHYRRLILTRWVAGLGLLLATALSAALLDGVALQVVPLIALGLGILGYNAWLGTTQADDPPPAEARAEQVQAMRRKILLQVALDWASLTLFLHLTGGITSPALLFFFIHIIIVAILFPVRWSYSYSGLVLLTVGLLTLAESVGVLPHYNVFNALPPDLYQESRYVVAILAFFGLTVLTITLLIDSIMQPARRREAELAALFETTQAVSSTLNLTGVLAQLSRHACESLGARGTTIRLLDPSQRYLDLQAAHGDGYFSQARIDIAPGSPHEAAIGGAVVAVTPATMANYPAELIQKGTGQTMLIPIHAESALGILSIYFREPVTVTAAMRSFARAIADQGATAITNALAHDALHEAEQQRARFVHVVTHELRSPVVGAQSLLRALMRRHEAELTETQHDILTRLAKRMDALQTLINDLLSLAETRARDMQEPLTRLDALPIINNVVDGYRAQADEKHITLSYSPPSEAVRVLATETSITRIADNLVGNAIKYTPHDGLVTVSLTSEGVLTVQDTGIGIPQENLDKLGTAFFRANNAKASEITGTGLGLATVQQLLDYIGGAMKVQSVVNEGTTFTVQLPAIAEHQPIPSAPSSPPPASSSPPTSPEEPSHAATLTHSG